MYKYGQSMSLWYNFIALFFFSIENKKRSKFVGLQFALLQAHTIMECHQIAGFEQAAVEYILNIAQLAVNIVIICSEQRF